MIDIDAALAICEAATPGPWEEYPRGTEFADAWCQGVASPGLVNICGMHDGGRTENSSVRRDAEFIAAAREGWPAALKELRAARSVLDQAASYAHAQGLFQGGMKPPLADAVVSIIKRAWVAADEAEAERDELKVLYADEQQRSVAESLARQASDDRVDTLQASVGTAELLRMEDVADASKRQHNAEAERDALQARLGDVLALCDEPAHPSESDSFSAGYRVAMSNIRRAASEDPR